MICSNSNLRNIEIRNLRSYFFQDVYPNWFFDKVLEQFQSKLASQTQTQTSNEKDFSYLFYVPYFGKTSRVFASRFPTFSSCDFYFQFLVYLLT